MGGSTRRNLTTGFGPVSWDDLSNMQRIFSAGVSVPAAQFYGRPRDPESEGRRRLCVAVLKQAKYDWSGLSRMRSDYLRARTRREIEEWLADGTPPFGFLVICETLGIDARRVRKVSFSYGP